MKSFFHELCFFSKKKIYTLVALPFGISGVVVEVINTGSDSFTAKMWMSLVFGDDHALYTDESCHSRCDTLKNPHNSMVIGQYMQPFTGNGDVSKCVKNYRVGPPQTKQIITIYKANNIRKLRLSIIPAAGVFVLASKLDIVYIIENYYNVNN